MDNYDRFEDSLNDYHDYNACMANCPDGKDCGCGGGGDEALGWLSLGLTILLIVVVCVIIHVVTTYKENKELREWREKREKERKEKKK